MPVEAVQCGCCARRKQQILRGKGVATRCTANTLFAFLFGFLLASFCLIFYQSPNLRLQTPAPTLSKRAAFQTGYMQALADSSVEQSTLVEQLSRETRILCMVLTCPKYHQQRAVHIRRTWGRRCNKLIFASSEADAELGAVAVVDKADDLYTNLWNKTRAGLHYIYEEHFEDYDWFLKADDDTYVVMENLRYMLYAYHPETPIYFGYKLFLPPTNMEYMSGGASYVMSKEALRRVIAESFERNSCCPNQFNYAEDVCMGYCMHRSKVHLADTHLASRQDRKPKFFPLDLPNFVLPIFNESIPEWLVKMTPYQLEAGLDCCSNYSIVFHYSEPSSMYHYEFLIYHFRAFGLQQEPRVAALPAKFTAEEIEKLFPLEVVEMTETKSSTADTKDATNGNLSSVT